MVQTPKTEVPLCWDQHSKLLPGVTNIQGNDVGRWNIDQVAGFVNTLPGCEEQAKLFQEQVGGFIWYHRVCEAFPTCRYILRRLLTITLVG